MLDGTSLVAEYLPSLRNGIELYFRVWARYARALRARAKKVFYLLISCHRRGRARQMFSQACMLLWQLPVQINSESSESAAFSTSLCKSHWLQSKQCSDKKSDMNHMNCNRVKHAVMSASLHPLYATADRDGKLLRQIYLLAQGEEGLPKGEKLQRLPVRTKLRRFEGLEGWDEGFKKPRRRG